MINKKYTLNKILNTKNLLDLYIKEISHNGIDYTDKFCKTPLNDGVILYYDNGESFSFYDRNNSGMVFNVKISMNFTILKIRQAQYEAFFKRMNLKPPSNYL